MACGAETIRLDNLSIGYRVKGGVRIVAQSMDATVKGGRLTCLIGSNGVGKSTLLKTLAAFQPKLGGHIYIKGKELSGYNRKEQSRLTSVVLTSRADTVNMTAREVVGLGRTPYTGFWGTLTDEDKRIVERSLELAGIETLAGRMVGTLSDGERQKVMIAKALAQQTPIIILDEPTAFLDYPSKVEVIQLMMRLSHEEGKTVFMSTHDLELVLQTADDLWLMMRGGKLVTGTPLELSENGTLAEFVERPGITYDSETKRFIVRGTAACGGNTARV